VTVNFESQIKGYINKIWKNLSEEDIKRFKEEYEIGKDLLKWYKAGYSKEGKGVFIEVLEEEFRRESIQIPILEFSGKNLNELLNSIRKLIDADNSIQTPIQFQAHPRLHT